MEARKGCATVTKIMEYWLLATADSAVYTLCGLEPRKIRDKNAHLLFRT